MVEGEADGGGARGNIEFGVDGREMRINRAWAEEEAFRDLGIRQSRRDEAQHLDFPHGEAGGIGGFRGWRGHQHCRNTVGMGKRRLRAQSRADTPRLVEQ